MSKSSEGLCRFGECYPRRLTHMTGCLQEASQHQLLKVVWASSQPGRWVPMVIIHGESKGGKGRERLETTQKKALSSLWPSLGRYISSLCHTPVTGTIPRPSPALRRANIDHLSWWVTLLEVHLGRDKYIDMAIFGKYCLLWGEFPVIIITILCNW